MKRAAIIGIGPIFMPDNDFLIAEYRLNQSQYPGVSIFSFFSIMDPEFFHAIPQRAGVYSKKSSRAVRPIDLTF